MTNVLCMIIDGCGTSSLYYDFMTAIFSICMSGISEEKKNDLLLKKNQKRALAKLLTCISSLQVGNSVSEYESLVS